MSRPFITRFAPSPTGPLHLGHAYAAKVAYHLAVQSEGRMILRIDDIDYTRCRDEFIQSIYSDMNWRMEKFQPRVSSVFVFCLLK